MARNQIMLFEDSWEHRHFVETEKCAYTCLIREWQCLQLVFHYNQAFDIIVKLPLFYDPIKDAWVVNIRDPNINQQSILFDKLVSITLPKEPPEYYSIQLVASPLDSYKYSMPTDITISRNETNPLSIDPDGIPLVAMQYTNLHLEVHCKTDPGNVMVRYRYLPSDKRRTMAISSHTINAYNNNKRYKLFVHSGIISEKTFNLCCIM